jgi:hypothetical protein
VDNLKDTALDNPQAEESFGRIVAAARDGGWLDASFTMPTCAHTHQVAHHHRALYS